MKEKKEKGVMKSRIKKFTIPNIFRKRITLQLRGVDKE